MWMSFDELFNEAFEEHRDQSNFMLNSDAKVMYFRLLTKYKVLIKSYMQLSRSYNILLKDFSKLNKKYKLVTSSTDVVPGHIHRKLNSKYNVLAKDYARLLDANVRLSDELTYIKTCQDVEDIDDFNS